MAEQRSKLGLDRVDHELVAGFGGMHYCLKLSHVQHRCFGRRSERHAGAVADSSAAEEGGMGAKQLGLFDYEGQLVEGSLKLVSVEVAVGCRQSGT